MRPADELVLKALQPFMSEMGYNHVVAKTEEAGGIQNLIDVTAVMELEMAKAKFGSRSAAGQYAANIRWREYDSAGSSGMKMRTEMVGGVPTRFTVTDTTIGQMSVGDIVTTGSNRVPTRVVSVENRGGGVVLTTQQLNGFNRYETTEQPNRAAKLWKPVDGKEIESSGSLNPSRKVDTKKLSREDLQFINTGGSGPERVRRRNEVIDRYASQGIDVSKPTGRANRGGAQWLGPAAN
jgi:hypothetical protein